MVSFGRGVVQFWCVFGFIYTCVFLCCRSVSAQTCRRLKFGPDGSDFVEKVLLLVGLREEQRLGLEASISQYLVPLWEEEGVLTP